MVVDGQATGARKDRELTDLCLHRIGFIFQTFDRINVLDVRLNVEFPLLLQAGLTAAERWTGHSAPGGRARPGRERELLRRRPGER